MSLQSEKKYNQILMIIVDHHKVGLTRFHPTSCDKSDKMHDKQKVLNNFPTTLFIKNWLSSKCIWVCLSQLLESIFLINSMLEELFKKFASLGGVQARSAWRFKFWRHGIAPLQTSIQITWCVGAEKKSPPHGIELRDSPCSLI